MLHFANYALQCVIIESIISVQLQKTIPWTTMVLAEKKSLCPKWGSKKTSTESVDPVSIAKKIRNFV